MPMLMPTCQNDADLFMMPMMPTFKHFFNYRILRENDADDADLFHVGIRAKPNSGAGLMLLMPMMPIATRAI